VRAPHQSTPVFPDHTPLTLSDVELDRRDAAELLYQNGLSGPLLMCLATGLTVGILWVSHAPQIPEMLAWLAIVLLIAVGRSVDIVASKQRRARPDWDGRTELIRFSVGLVATAATWVVFVLLFLPTLDGLQRTTIAIVLSAMAGGSGGLLGASLPLAITFAGAMLLPASFILLSLPGRENVILGLSGIGYFIFMCISSAVVHRGTMSAIRTARANQRLVFEMERERQRSDQTNTELIRAQTALNESLETLEERIRERTTDLEREIGERERYGRELSRLALHDSLTGLYNRATLTERLTSELRGAETAGASIAVLFLDLDRFKEVNDLLGHHAGDQVLREVAKRMSELVPPDAILARWGGDEFLFAQRSDDAHAAAQAIGDRFLRSVAEPIEIGNDLVRVGATIGISIFPDHGQTADELVRAADMAMYAAKHDGRGGMRTFTPELATALGKRHALEQALRDAIADKALRLVFQPIVDATTGACTSLEALLRWEGATHGSIGPSEFIPIAEQTGDIVAIGRWVLEHACAAAATWQAERPTPVAVNVSVAQIVGGTLLADVHRALDRSGLDATLLHLEVTESLFATDHEQTIPTLQALRGMGTRISLDDFGIGFSSLGYLRTLPIDTIKIDKTFIDSVEGESRAIVEAIQSIARAFDLGVVAEGVETEAQAVALRALGVRSLQGFYFSRPLEAHAVRVALEARDQLADRALST